MRIKETLAPSHEKNRSGRLYKANMSALHAYSGGTVRDFHPIPYSSAKCGHSDKIIIIYNIIRKMRRMSISAPTYMPNRHKADMSKNILAKIVMAFFRIYAIIGLGDLIL